MLQAAFLFIVAAFGVWIAAGLIVTGVSAFSRYFRLSSFSVSFFVLGLLTSIPELSVGLNSIHDGRPDIFIGNLMGASVVLFLLVIPLLAIIGKGVELDKNLAGRNLPLILLTIFAPVVFGIDGSFSRIEAGFMVLLYGTLFYVLKRRKGILTRIADSLLHGDQSGWRDGLKIAVGAVLMYFASDALVQQTVAISGLLGVSTFMIGLLVLGLGTNVPELMIGIRSVLRNEKSIAFGNYVGSAAANTLLFGFFISLTGYLPVHREKVWIVFVFFLVGLLLFWLFAKSKSHLSRREGLALLLIYVLFVIAETWRRLSETNFPL